MTTRRSRSNSAAADESPSLLPTINTAKDDLLQPIPDEKMLGSPVYRKHSRQRSSTVLIAQEFSPPQEPEPTIKTRAAALFGGAGALAGAQLLAKLLSFVLNHVVLRFVDANDFGAAAQLEFAMLSVISLARDAVRFAAQRLTLDGLAADEYRGDGRPVHGTASGTVQETVNLGYVSIAIGAPLATAAALFLFSENPMPALTFGLAAIIELLAEPCFLVGQLHLELRQRAVIEAQSTVCRALITCFLVAIVRCPAVLAFAIGQLAYAVAYCIWFYIRYMVSDRLENFRLYPRKVWSALGDEGMFIDPVVGPRAAGMGAQAVLKFLLTESDRLVVSLIMTHAQQGAFALAANYGSLVARLGLFPVEEALRGVFAKSLPQRDAPIDKAKPDSPTLKSPVASTNDVGLAARVFCTTLRVYAYIGVAAAALGPALAPYLLSIAAGKQWQKTEAPRVLAAYMIYIPVLALNGACEAFVQATASLADIRRQSIAFVAVAASFVIFAYVFMGMFGLGAVGLVAAQMLAMALRAGWALIYARDYFAQHGRSLRNAVPRTLPLAAAVAIGAASYAQGPVQSLTGLAIHGALGIALVLVAAYTERDLLRAIT